ncbi:S-methyl-5-thioribose-1-phosphate isomerase [Exophiala mesophila]|uniref:Methylthioribose-1-phosphate isomerase n=1 Tax=Exophiala mesophila TaxID=212818 RepID=A0A0D2A5A7_EXOME|nr:S-methyl-5-thioribose-1-phosphate isomerase [Exophiala mesophila]KIV94203.1 S-methyl-5-thioribose-1-phosphate isomerase [Exophiala mesophila]
MVLEAIQYDPASENAPPSLRVLDQLQLPHRTTFEQIKTCEEAHDAIKKMKVRGAPAIAIVAALALAVEVGSSVVQHQLPHSPEEVRTTLGGRLDYLQTSRPTAVNLGDAVGKLKVVAQNAASKSDASAASVAQAYIVAAERMLVDDVSDNRAIGEYGARWIEANTAAGRKRRSDRHAELKVLTHCNTGSLATAGYGTALGVIRSLRASDNLTRAYCTETRPYNQGSRLTAFELVHDDIPATLVTDSMACALLAKEKDSLAAIVVGADRVAANGDTANKIGTYSLAVLARHHGVKFLVAAPRTTIDRHTLSGADIVIEQRAPEEVTRIKGPKVDDNGKILIDEGSELISTAASGIEVWNPAFDVTPAHLIDGVITEVGVVEKKDGKFDFEAIFT